MSTVAGRFIPTHLSDEDIDDLATFTRMDRAACVARVRDYTSSELATAWEKANPRTPDEMRAFYQSTDLYIWDLMQWHASDDRQVYRDALQCVVTHFPPDAGWRRVYDFGAGIGSDALFLASRGYDVTLEDVGGPTLNFARHRFARRGLSARFVETASGWPEPDHLYDVAVSVDVLEHLPDPLEALRRLVAALKPDGVFVHQATFAQAIEAPYHLADGVRRFGGGRWYPVLAGCGLHVVGPLVYRKSPGAIGMVQRTRHALWHATGLWVGRRGLSLLGRP